MSEIIAIELKSDLEHVYKLTGDLLNEIETAGMDKNGNISCDMLERMRAVLMDTGAVLQKDIFNCDFIISSMKFRKPQETEIFN